MKREWMAAAPETKAWSRFITLSVKSICVVGALSSLAQAQSIGQRLSCLATFSQSKETIALKALGDRLVGQSNDGRYSLYVALNDETSCGGMQIFEIAKAGSTQNSYAYQSFCGSRSNTMELDYLAASHEKLVQLNCALTR